MPEPTPLSAPDLADRKLVDRVARTSRRLASAPVVGTGGAERTGGTSRGIELAATVAVMVGIGWLLDRWFGTEPLMIIVLTVVGFVGTGVKLYYGYDLEMRRHEDGAIWNRESEDRR
jgi:F0F1-type ATP synthase assembly protein I